MNLFTLLIYAAALSAAGADEQKLTAVVTVDPAGAIGPVSPLVYGHFLEHFHRIVYGGIYDPDSPLADKHGFRKDVIAAMRRIKVPILRWPGGCFASAYHWKDGIGHQRTATWDKAWRVEEPNTFGTDEFITFCRLVGAEPYICGNAGTGQPKELSDWVEYCNLKTGKWAQRRMTNGFTEPHTVRFWSIGNENWGGYEVGTKTADEFVRFVVETAKMMRRVDSAIEVVVPTDVYNSQWTKILLGGAGWQMDCMAIHYYADPLCYENKPSPYPVCAGYSLIPEEKIAQTEALLRQFGHERIKIAFDEWNLRGWHHPGFTAPKPNLGARDLNDLNSTYTCADAVFAGCFLNACLRHADRVRIANFAPVVNCRGAIFTQEQGIVLRPTYHVFDLYVNHTLPTALDTAVKSDLDRIGDNQLPIVDAMMTGDQDGAFALAAVNRHDRLPVEVELKMSFARPAPTAELFTVTGEQPDSFNDVDHPQDVNLQRKTFQWDPEHPVVRLPPHSVNAVCFSAASKASNPDLPLANGDFERQSCPSLPYRWRPKSWSGLYRAQHVQKQAHSGKWCVMLESIRGANCAWSQEVAVRPNRRYRLSGWIRTQGVDGQKGKGAFLEVQELTGQYTPPVARDTQWSQVEIFFETANQIRITVNCKLTSAGGQSCKCWFDDIELELLGTDR